MNNDIIERYTHLPSTFNYPEYVSINPFDKKSRKILKKIDFEIGFARGELIKFHSELLDVKDAKLSEDLDSCFYSRTLLYEALASGIQNIFHYAQVLVQRLGLKDTKEYQSFISYADDAYFAVIENEEYLIYVNSLDENEDDEDGSLRIS